MKGREFLTNISESITLRLGRTKKVEIPGEEWEQIIAVINTENAEPFKLEEFINDQGQISKRFVSGYNCDEIEKRFDVLGIGKYVHMCTTPMGNPLWIGPKWGYDCKILPSTVKEGDYTAEIKKR